MSPGPPPKHPSVRARKNNPKADFRSLPAGGREGAAPPWPLQPDVALTAELEMTRDRVATLQVQVETESDGRKRGRLSRNLDKLQMAAATLAIQVEQADDLEKALWADLWSTPQAVLWEESHALREVAQYVRWKVRAEQGDIKAAAEARALSDRLGLNPLALLRLRAEVERVEDAEDRGRRRRTTTPRPAAKGDDDPRSGLYAVS